MLELSLSSWWKCDRGSTLLASSPGSVAGAIAAAVAANAWRAGECVHTHQCAAAVVQPGSSSSSSSAGSSSPQSEISAKTTQQQVSDASRSIATRCTADGHVGTVEVDDAHLDSMACQSDARAARLRHSRLAPQSDISSWTDDESPRALLVARYCAECHSRGVDPGSISPARWMRSTTSAVARSLQPPRAGRRRRGIIRRGATGGWTRIYSNRGRQPSHQNQTRAPRRARPVVMETKAHLEEEEKGVRSYMLDDNLKSTTERAGLGHNLGGALPSPRHDRRIHADGSGCTS